MIKFFNNEEVICSIKSYRDVKTTNVITNFFANFISWGVAGMVTNDFKLTLTQENLYIEAKGHATWGGLPETMYTDKIAREYIKSFEVKIEGSEEFIEIQTKDEKTMTFIRDNEKNNNLALEMAKLISKN